MRKTLTIPAILALCFGLSAGSALAEEGCFAPMGEWQPREAVVKLAAARGWTVRRIKIDDGCYEIDGKDQAGKRIEVIVHPATLEVLQLEHEEPEGDEDED